MFRKFRGLANIWMIGLILCVGTSTAQEPSSAILDDRPDASAEAPRGQAELESPDEHVDHSTHPLSEFDDSGSAIENLGFIQLVAMFFCLIPLGLLLIALGAWALRYARRRKDDTA